MAAKDLGRNRGVPECACDLSLWRGGIMVVPEWCKAHKLLYAWFGTMTQYRFWR